METQSNTQRGTRVLPTTADLTGKEGHLCKLANSAGTTIAALPTAASDICPFFIRRVNSATEVEVEPLDPTSNHRLRLKGAANPGATLVIATGDDAGMVEAGAEGHLVALAEELGEDGQLLLVRPINRHVEAAG